MKAISKAGEPMNVTVNPDLKANPNDPVIQKKIKQAEEILASLKEPLEDQIQALRKGKTSA